MLSYEEWTKRLRKLVYSSAPAEIDQAREELQRDWRDTQQRIAALEVQMRADAEGALLLSDAHKADLEIAHRYGRERLAPANLRAERLAGALLQVDALGVVEFTERRDVIHDRLCHMRQLARATLVAEPDASPLRQVAQALAFYAEFTNYYDDQRIEGRSNAQRDAGAKAQVALRLLAELGVT